MNTLIETFGSYDQRKLYIVRTGLDREIQTNRFKKCALRGTCTRNLLANASKINYEALGCTEDSAQKIQRSSYLSDRTISGALKMRHTNNNHKTEASVMCSNATVAHRLISTVIAFLFLLE